MNTTNRYQNREPFHWFKNVEMNKFAGFEKRNFAWRKIFILGLAACLAAGIGALLFTQSATPVTDSVAAAGWTTMVVQYVSSCFTPHRLIQSTLVLVIVLIGYSITMAGKQGWGWKVMTALAAMVGWVGKLLLSMFVEVTSPNCPPDWDED